MAVTTKNRAEQPSEFAPGRFVREVYDELRKVVWPTAGELYRYTLIVIFTVILLGAFIGGARVIPPWIKRLRDRGVIR